MTNVERSNDEGMRKQECRSPPGAHAQWLASFLCNAFSVTPRQGAAKCQLPPCARLTQCQPCSVAGCAPGVATPGCAVSTPSGWAAVVDVALKDKSLEDSEDLPEPDMLAQEIADDLQTALDQFAGIAGVRNEVNSHTVGKRLAHRFAAGGTRGEDVVEFQLPVEGAPVVSRIDIVVGIGEYVEGIVNESIALATRQCHVMKHGPATGAERRLESGHLVRSREGSTG